jgi:pimeloyl-ACP methyl ester carboxylesterase
MLREGAGEPLVLLHGVICGERVWRHVAPLLAPTHDVIAPAALGHYGGRRATVRPTNIEHIVDDAERSLDELGLESPHLAGNSMGGWVALELARRGRARTVCALSPAGFWDHSWEDKHRAFRVLTKAAQDTRHSRTILPLLARSRRFRRWALRYGALHGERVSRTDLIDLAEDTIGCEIYEDIEGTTDQIAPLDSSPCPITLAWSGQDRIFPVDLYAARARELIPGADFIVLDDVGHMPMLDDPQLVADTILAVTGAVASGD